MTEKELYSLELAILKAEKKAREFEKTEDGGTCNFDSLIVKLDATKKQLAGLEWKIEKVDGKIFKGWYFVNICLSGQGNRRTRMVEAAAKSLCESGYQASVYYEVD